MRLQARNQEACLGRRRGLWGRSWPCRAGEHERKGGVQSRASSGHRRGRERAWGTEVTLDVVSGVRPEGRSEALRSQPSAWLESRGGRHGHWWAPWLGRC